MKSFKLVVLGIVMFGVIVEVSVNDVKARNADAKYLWKMATVAPDGVGYTIYTNKVFTKKIKEVTNKEVLVNWYHGCIMGDEEDYLAKMRINQLQGCGVSAGGILMISPEMSVLQLPFLFNDFSEVDYIKNKMRNKFTLLLRKRGFKALMLIHQDFDQIYSTKYKMATLADFKKSKFVNHAGFIEHMAIKALGASPIPLGIPEVASATRSGVIDTCICPPMWTLGTQLYTIDKYVNTLKWKYSNGVFVLSNRAWDSLPEKHKIAINNVLPELEAGFNDIAINSNIKALKAMINYGMKEVVLTPDQVEKFRKRLLPLWDTLVGKKFSKDVLDEILVHLKDYRTQKK